MSSKPPVPPDRWRFGQFELDVSTRELRKNGLRIHIQEQPLRILGALLDRPGELVTREELRERLWPADTFVDFERSLNAAVAKLRQTLADSADQPRYVETIAGRGYRFIAPVEPSLMPIPPPLAPQTTVARKHRIDYRLALAGFGLLCTLAAAGLYWSSRTRSGEASVVRFVLTPPAGTRMHAVFAVSPDGLKLAFVAADSSGKRALWVRELASEAPLRLEHTDGAIAPFFSPDSEHIGFFAEGKVKRVPATGGIPKILADQNQAAGGSWNRDNVILFSQAGRLYRVSAEGGLATELQRPVPGPGEFVVDTWPQFLPDGKRFVYCSKLYTGHLYPDRGEVLLGSIESSKRQLVMAGMNRVAVTPAGDLLYLRNRTLLAQKLDLDKAQLTGEPWTLADNLTIHSGDINVDVKPGMPVSVASAAFSVSNNGVLAYHSDQPLTRQLVWFDRSGKRLALAGEPREFTQLMISPDEKWAAVGIRSNSKIDRSRQNIWLLKLDTNVLSRLSFGKGVDADPVWSPDSSRVVYGAFEPEHVQKINLMEAALGEGAQREFYADGKANKPEAWSPDGRTLLMRLDEQVVLSLPLAGERKPRVILDTPYFRGRFQFSPDGRAVAYASHESGHVEVYVSSFPAMTGTRQVSLNGGSAPIWRKDGRELFYMTHQGHIMSVDVRGSGPAIVTGTPHVLFQAMVQPRTIDMGQYGVVSNGQKFLVSESPQLSEGDGRTHLITHWEALRRR